MTPSLEQLGIIRDGRLKKFELGRLRRKGVKLVTSKEISDGEETIPAGARIDDLELIEDQLAVASFQHGVVAAFADADVFSLRKG
jgi:hypothetical protein